MGIFDWLTGRKGNVELLDDKIWLTKTVKFERISDSVAQRLASPNPPAAVILLAHFQDCLAELQRIAKAGHFDAPVTAAAAEELKDGPAAGPPFGESHTIDIVVAERHPLASHDKAVVDFARGLSCPCRVEHHLSLDDALLKSFAGEWVRNLVRRLGLKDEQSIDGKLVTRRIRQCQARLKRLVAGEEPAVSAEQWMERNLPTSLGNR
jgi:hypothetical protein